MRSVHLQIGHNSGASSRHSRQKELARAFSISLILSMSAHSVMTQKVQDWAQAVENSPDNIRYPRVSDPEFPLVVAANRDEFYWRAGDPRGWWDEPRVESWQVATSPAAVAPFAKQERPLERGLTWSFCGARYWD